MPRAATGGWPGLRIPTHGQATLAPPRPSRSWPACGSGIRRSALRCPPGALFARGDLANLFKVSNGLLKLARNPADNDLMDREAAAMRTLARRVPARLAAYFPRFLEAQRVDDPRTGAERRGNLIGALDGFISLAEVRRRFAGGVDPRDAAWMWRRLLVALGAAHRAGVDPRRRASRARADPSGRARARAGRLVLLGSAGAPLPAIVGRYRDWYPPEVLSRQHVRARTDIWLATSCMTGLIGDRLPAPLGAFARGCLLASAAPPPAGRLAAACRA